MKIRILDEVQTPRGVGCVTEFNQWGEMRVWFDDKDPNFTRKPIWRGGSYQWFKKEDVTKINNYGDTL